MKVRADFDLTKIELEKIYSTKNLIEVTNRLNTLRQEYYYENNEEERKIIGRMIDEYKKIEYNLLTKSKWNE